MYTPCIDQNPNPPPLRNPDYAIDYDASNYYLYVNH